MPDFYRICYESLAGVNISPFIDNLPLGKDTVNFSTADASGSTSQAANIIEALEVIIALRLRTSVPIYEHIF